MTPSRPFQSLVEELVFKSPFVERDAYYLKEIPVLIEKVTKGKDEEIERLNALLIEYSARIEELESRP